MMGHTPETHEVRGPKELEPPFIYRATVPKDILMSPEANAAASKAREDLLATFFEWDVAVALDSSDDDF